MNSVLLLLIAILPIFIICFLVYIKDNEKEPISLLVKLYISGVFSVFLVYLFTFLLQRPFNFFRVMPSSSHYIKLFIYIFITIALVEEISKFIMAFVFGYKDKNFDEPYDIIIYTVFVSLGFATFENILYVLQNGMSNAIVRAFTAVPMHACYGIFMGYYLSLSRIAKKNKAFSIHRKNIILSVVVPVLLHTLYDYLIFLNSPFFLLILIDSVVVMYYFAILKLLQIANVSNMKVSYN